ncbi:MAG TPA: hypothetical protein VKC62_01495 [Gaiellaceae bacterium]|nr:hypothetical protein [Gaiellaceae bacterium]
MSTYGLELPRAGRAAAPFAVLAALALLFEADPRLPWIVGVAAAAVFAAAAGVRAYAARRELAAVRLAADRLILNAAQHDDGSALIAWREHELVARHERQRLRREVDRTLRGLDPARLPSASPLKRTAARANIDLFRRLDERLGDGRPVSAKGVLLAESLLRSPGSPLYNDDAERLLPRALSRILGALEP